MCGIWLLINKDNKDDYLNDTKYFWNIKNRGPDNSTLNTFSNTCIGFHRLAIMDNNISSNQPYILHDEKNLKTIIFIANGEVYNYRELDKKYNLNIKNSDCLTIPKLYKLMIEEHGDKGVNKWLEMFKDEIKGEFAFCLLEFDSIKNLQKIITGRDQIGVRPLYYHEPTKESTKILFTSELKGGLDFKDSLEEFPPGHIFIYRPDIFTSLCKTEFNFRNYYVESIIDSDENYLKNVRESVINSIKRRLNSDRPKAFLLSGGVDSSLIAGISSKLLKEPLNTFCCGMEGATDFEYARKVADYIKSNHTEVIFTKEDGLNAIKDVIYATETWDVTTIRASIGQYLISKYISEKTDCKVVMVGEGPDEVCSSYLFNFYSPENELHSTAIEYVDKIHLFDGRRSDRCISNCGLEGRVALLDPEFIRAYWSIPEKKRHPKYKNMEKWWLRQAFNNLDVLPDEVLWRKKEAFSDGVSSKKESWFETLQNHINSLVDDNYTPYKYNNIETKTKESYYYMKVFIEIFGEKRVSVIPHYWQPKWLEDGTKNNFKEYLDPSARTLSVYNAE